jgi:hypothetical protein
MLIKIKNILSGLMVGALFMCVQSSDASAAGDDINDWKLMKSTVSRLRAEGHKVVVVYGATSNQQAYFDFSAYQSVNDSGDSVPPCIIYVDTENNPGVFVKGSVISIGGDFNAFVCSRRLEVQLKSLVDLITVDVSVSHLMINFTDKLTTFSNMLAPGGKIVIDYRSHEATVVKSDAEVLDTAARIYNADSRELCPELTFKINSVREISAAKAGALKTHYEEYVRAWGRSHLLPNLQLTLNRDSFPYRVQTEDRPDRNQWIEQFRDKGYLELTKLAS